MIHEYAGRRGGGSGPADQIISSSATNGEIFEFIRVYSAPPSFLLQSS